MSSGFFLAKIVLFTFKMISLTSAVAIYDLLKPQFNSETEEFWGIFLNSNLQILSLKLLHRGSAYYCTIHPRDLLKEALKHNAHSIIVAHNHPSRQLLPSEADIKITKKIKKLCRELEFHLIDHIIFSDVDYFSFKNADLL